MGLGRTEAEHEVIKPLTFKAQEFKRIVLDNHLEFLLVSDLELDKSGAAIDVRVGSLMDPKEMPGLAHFCEHMLFYASEKYPEEDAYSRFLSEHGGHTNAYTAAESTNYHFDCNWDSLEEALDRFAQFFISPLISEHGVEREVNAVDSEHNKNLNTDAWRKMQLWRHTANPGHPFNRFSTGNLETLLHTPKARGQQPHKEVRDFHTRHYSSNVMKGAVVGKQSLPELEALVRAKFGAVPNVELAVPEFAGDVLAEGQTGQLLRVVPVKEEHCLEMQWAVPAEQRVYRAAPCGYLGHLLGHEGYGSIFAVLKARGWATSLSAGEGGGSFSACSFFTVNITLTDEGMEHLQEIVETVFAYIRLVSEEGGVTEDRFQQYRDLAQLRFNFSEKQNPLSLAQMLASQLQKVPAQDVLLALHHVAQEYHEGAIRAVLKEMTPQDVRIMWSSKKFKGQTTQVEPWYGTEFSQEAIPEDWLLRWQAPNHPADLHLPHNNPFISSDFTLIDVKDTDADQPQIMHESPMLRLWHKPSTRFTTPKAIIYLHFHCPESYTSPEAAVLSRLFVKLLSDYLNEIAYDAELAGLSWGLQNTVSGFLVSFLGYSHKLMELVSVVLDKIGSFLVDDERFQVQKEAAVKEYANTRYQQPYQTAMYEAAVLLEARRWHTDSYEAVIPDMQPLDLTAFIKRMMGRCFVEAYATGNFSAEQASHLAATIESLLKDRLRSKPLFPSQQQEKRVIKLRPGQPALMALPVPNPDDDNSAVMVGFQVGPDDLRSNALAQLLVQCIKRDAFHTLRTVEQLGYLVWLSAYATLTVQGIAFVIQSTAFPAAHLEARAEAFMAATAQQLQDLDPEAFSSQVEELAKAKLEKPKRLRQLAAHEWREIDNGLLVFDRPAAEVEVLRTLTKEDLLEFFQEILLDETKRRKLSVHVMATPEMQENGAAEAQSETSALSPEQQQQQQQADYAASGNDSHPENDSTAATGAEPAAADQHADGSPAAGQPVEQTGADQAAAGAKDLLEGGQQPEEDKTGAEQTAAAAKPGDGLGKLVSNGVAAAVRASGKVPVDIIKDAYAFKRAQEVYPSSR